MAPNIEIAGIDSQMCCGDTNTTIVSGVTWCNRPGDAFDIARAGFDVEE